MFKRAVKKRNKSKWKSIYSSLKDPYTILCIILILSLPLVNIFIFEVFYLPANLNTTTNPDAITNLIKLDYLESNIFKIVTISIILPLLAAIISRIFKLRDRANLLREKNVYNEKDQKKEYQLETINKTVDFWRTLIKLTTYVRFYDLRSDKRIEDIRVELDELIIQEKNLKNMWSFRFKSQYINENNYLDLLQKPIDVLIDATYTVAKFIHDNPFNFDPRQKLQYQLGVIETNVKNMAYDRVISVLNNIMNYDYYEPELPYYEGDANKKEAAKCRINYDIEYLKNWSNQINSYILKDNDIADFISDESQKESLHKLCDKFIKDCKGCIEKFQNTKQYRKPKNLDLREMELKKYNDELIKKLSKDKKIKECFNTITDYRDVQSTKRCYSIEFMRILARELDIKDLCAEIVERADWSKEDLITRKHKICKK